MDKIFNLDGKLMQTMNKFADIMFLNVITLICCIPIITYYLKCSVMSVTA